MVTKNYFDCTLIVYRYNVVGTMLILYRKTVHDVWMMTSTSCNGKTQPTRCITSSHFGEIVALIQRHDRSRTVITAI